jgi:uroporphyrinogen-III decarboxylase
MENIIAAGIDCVQPMEAKTGMDLAELGREFGDRIAFMGNIDIRALETNDRAQVDAEVLPKLRAVREQRIPYIFHTDHSVSPLVRIETYAYAVDLFRRHCRYERRAS